MQGRKGGGEDDYIVGSSKLLVIISNPSKTNGKAVYSTLQRRFPGVRCSVSVAAQGPHPKRISNIGCCFTSGTQFRRLLTRSTFLRRTGICSRCCNAPGGCICRVLRRNGRIVLRVSVRKTVRIGGQCPRNIFVCVMPPDQSILRGHLHNHRASSSSIVTNQLTGTQTRLS